MLFEQLSKWAMTTFFIALLFVDSLQTASAVTLAKTSLEPTQPENCIDIWYGKEQHFGTPGLAQRWINIPGKVNLSNQLTSLQFSLNNGPLQPLHIGPDSRRLSAPGDFNIEINARDLQPGNNNLRITCILKDGNHIDQQVLLNYRVKPWPLPYSIEWTRLNNIQNAIQVVDGLWQLTETGIRTAPEYIGYDRSLAIGDESWSSYEIVVPFTVNRIDASIYGSPESVSPGLGIILHWNGHTDTPVDCGQPHCGWFPVGAIHGYIFPENGASGFNINTRAVNDLTIDLPYELETGITYLMRSRVETYPFRTMYFHKVWYQGEEEPAKWSLQQTADQKNPDHGGFLLVAHHVDLTFGNITVTPVNSDKSVPFKEYLVLFPLLLTITAGLLFLLFFRVNRKTNRRKSVIIVFISLVAIALLMYLEPLFPRLLQRFHFNARMTEGLYFCYDFSFSLFLALVWIIILLAVFRKNQHEAIQ